MISGRDVFTEAGTGLADQSDSNDERGKLRKNSEKKLGSKKNKNMAEGQCSSSASSRVTLTGHG